MRTIKFIDQQGKQHQYTISKQLGILNDEYGEPINQGDKVFVDGHHEYILKWLDDYYGFKFVSKENRILHIQPDFFTIQLKKQTKKENTCYNCFNEQSIIHFDHREFSLKRNLQGVLIFVDTSTNVPLFDKPVNIYQYLSTKDYRVINRKD